MAAHLTQPSMYPSGDQSCRYDRSPFIASRDVVDAADEIVLSRSKEITDLATNGSQLAAVDQDGSCRIFSPDGEVLATYQLELPAKSLDTASYLKDPWGLYSVAFAGDAVLVGDGFGRIHRLV